MVRKRIHASQLSWDKRTRRWKNLILSKRSKPFCLQSPEQESEEGQTRYESLTVNADTEGEVWEGDKETNTNYFLVTQGSFVGWESNSYETHPVYSNRDSFCGSNIHIRATFSKSDIWKRVKRRWCSGYHLFSHSSTCLASPLSAAVKSLQVCAVSVRKWSGESAKYGFSFYPSISCRKRAEKRQWRCKAFLKKDETFQMFSHLGVIKA